MQSEQLQLAGSTAFMLIVLAGWAVAAYKEHQRKKKLKQQQEEALRKSLSPDANAVLRNQRTEAFEQPKIHSKIKDENTFEKVPMHISPKKKKRPEHTEVRAKESPVASRRQDVINERLLGLGAEALRSRQKETRFTPVKKLQKPQTLVEAIILSEILDSPKAFRFQSMSRRRK